MKIFKLLIISLSLFAFVNLEAQDCKVLLESISETYEGDCKKGKAHGKGKAVGTDTYEGEFKKGLPEGKGIYTWSNGNVFVGTFKKGKKEGEGELIIKDDGKVTKGFWIKDQYVGLSEKALVKHDKTQNISSLSLKNKGGEVNAVRFYMRDNERNVFNPQFDFSILHGSYTDAVDEYSYVELRNVVYPLRIKVFYKQDYFEIELFHPGLWDVRANMTYIRGLNSDN